MSNVLVFECEPYGSIGPLRFCYPSRTGVGVKYPKGVGGVLSREGVARLREFLQACEAQWNAATETPLITDDEE